MDGWPATKLAFVVRFTAVCQRSLTLLLLLLLATVALILMNLALQLNSLINAVHSAHSIAVGQVM